MINPQFNWNGFLQSEVDRVQSQLPTGFKIILHFSLCCPEQASLVVINPEFEGSLGRYVRPLGRSQSDAVELVERACVIAQDWSQLEDRAESEEPYDPPFMYRYSFPSQQEEVDSEESQINTYPEVNEVELSEYNWDFDLLLQTLLLLEPIYRHIPRNLEKVGLSHPEYVNSLLELDRAILRLESTFAVGFGNHQNLEEDSRDRL